MTQLLLPIDLGIEYNTIDFIVSISNIAAYKAIHNTGLWPKQRLMIHGESGSGKTHIAKIWAQRVMAHELQVGDELSTEHKFIYIDGIARFNPHDLLHIINYCNESHIYVLMISPTKVITGLEDLDSRLSSTYTVQISPPDEIMLRALLMKGFCDMQIAVKNEVIEYIAKNITRSFSAIKDLLYRLQNLSLEQHHKITIPFVKQIIDEKNEAA
jgi:chromosomal replication initiation ATPase DnaA